MLFSLCATLVALACTASAQNQTYLIFDVDINKGSTGNLKSAFNHLKEPRHAVKIIGEDRAFFMIPDDDDCRTSQIDFHGLNVDAAVATKSDEDVTLNKTGLVVIMIDTSLDLNAIGHVFEDVRGRCDNCFKVFTYKGFKPQRCLLVGNIPMDLIEELVTRTTTDKCCDKAYTKRATPFKSYSEKHVIGCNGLGSADKDFPKPATLPTRPVPSIAPIHPVLPVHPVHPGNSFPGSIKFGDNKFGAIRDPHPAAKSSLKPTKRPRGFHFGFPTFDRDNSFNKAFDFHGAGNGF